MNRRSFVTALAALASVPILGRFVTASASSAKPIEVNGMPMMRFSDSCVALYTADSYDEKAGIWHDLSGNCNDLFAPVSSPRSMSQEERRMVHEQIAEKFGLTLL